MWDSCARIESKDMFYSIKLMFGLCYIVMAIKQCDELILENIVHPCKGTVKSQIDIVFLVLDSRRIEVKPIPCP